MMAVKTPQTDRRRIWNISVFFRTNHHLYCTDRFVIIILFLLVETVEFEPGKTGVKPPSGTSCISNTLQRMSHVRHNSSSSSSSALQPGVGFGLHFFEGFVTTIVLQGGVVNPTPNPQIFWRTNVFCQGCLP
jgi:hypothetical protein